MDARVRHDWMVTAPWWRWTASDGSPRAGVPRFGRGTAPAIQKLADDDFINPFLKDPQRALRHDREVDEVHAVNLIAANPGQFAGKLATLFPMNAQGEPSKTGARRAQLVSTGVRKVYLPIHARHYLLICELHCDTPGFPAAPGEAVCQAGFVVRRRRLEIPREARPEATRLLRDLVAAQARLGDLEETLPVRPALRRSRAARIARLRATGQFAAQHAAARALVEHRREQLAEWRDAHGVRSVEEGWIPDTRKGFGEWRPIDGRPESLVEASFPLYRLEGDPNNPAHDAHGRSLYFGVLPTGGLEMTRGGEPRFDDRAAYEIRAFFRRHDGCCPRKGLNVDAPDCGGPVTWSEATDAYRLAAAGDLHGTSNRPVTIQMPDLAELAAQAMSRPAGRFSPVRFVQPQTLKPKGVGMPTEGGLGPGSICFFAIPLITIIALFVLNIFLPIVVFIFNLWFLLALKLCILPEVRLEGGLQAELALIPPKVDFEAELSVDVDAPGFSLEVGASTLSGADIRAQLSDTLEAAIEGVYGKRPDLDGYSNAPLVGLANVLTEHTERADAAAASGAGFLFDLAEGLEFEPRRPCQWMHEPHLPSTREYA